MRGPRPLSWRVACCRGRRRGARPPDVPAPTVPDRGRSAAPSRSLTSSPCSRAATGRGRSRRCVAGLAKSAMMPTSSKRLRALVVEQRGERCGMRSVGQSHGMHRHHALREHPAAAEEAPDVIAERLAVVEIVVEEGHPQPFLLRGAHGEDADIAAGQDEARCGRRAARASDRPRAAARPPRRTCRAGTCRASRRRRRGASGGPGARRCRRSWR